MYLPPPKKMGIATVAVYSDADRDALHVQMADEAMSILVRGFLSESYLVIDKIVQACLDTGADAVHPGYGFLVGEQQVPRRVGCCGYRIYRPGQKSH